MVEKVHSPVWQSYEIQQLVKQLTLCQGQDIDELLLGTGISSLVLENPSLKVSIEQELALYMRIAQRNQNPYLAIEHGSKMGLNYFSVLGLLMLSSENFKEALWHLVKYYPLISWASSLVMEKSVGTSTGLVQLIMMPTPADEVTNAFEVQSTFVGLLQVFNQILMERVSFESVHLKGSGDEDLKQKLQTTFNCPVVLNAFDNRIVLNQQWLQRKLPAAEPEYSEILQTLCQRNMENLNQERGIVGSVKRYIAGFKEGYPNIETVAAHLNHSSRTLRRRLKEAGTSYQLIVEDIRFDKARQLLMSSQFSIEAIAHMLHYSDSRSFRTAFKRWQGETPGQFRNRL